MIVEVKKPTLRNRIRRIGDRKLQLEKRIREEMRRPVPDALRLQTLKRLRLRAKDEIRLLRERIREGYSRPSRPSAA